MSITKGRCLICKKKCDKDSYYCSDLCLSLIENKCIICNKPMGDAKRFRKKEDLCEGCKLALIIKNKEILSGKYQYLERRENF